MILEYIQTQRHKAQRGEQILHSSFLCVLRASVFPRLFSNQSEVKAEA